jgi:hypothetical protein
MPEPDAEFDAALQDAGLTPDARDRAAALRIALFLRQCRARLGNSEPLLE